MLKYILASAELILMVLFLISLPFVNMGNIAGVAVSLILMLITLRFDLVKRLWSVTGGRIALCAAAAVMLAAAGFGIFCTVKMLQTRNVQIDDPAAVVVLGCQIRGDSPSRMLKRRLDAAHDYLVEHPDVPVIVSGGKGSDEDYPEAVVMKNYLIGTGIDEGRIFTEEKSSTTDENLEFSFALMDELGLRRDIVLVTDGYHQYRAQLIAEKHGADRIGSVSAETEFRFIPTYWVREWFGIFQQLALK